jgi:hypothetical protein
MKKRKLYRYIGRNGTITSPILLEDIKYISLMELRPEIGHALTDGVAIRTGSIVVHIDEVDNWTEIEYHEPEVISE